MLGLCMFIVMLSVTSLLNANKISVEFAERRV